MPRCKRKRALLHLRQGACITSTASALSEVVAQSLAPTGMAQAIESLVFDLADALSGEAELLPHLFQRMGAAVP